jgi:hypothetical protein
MPSKAFLRSLLLAVTFSFVIPTVLIASIISLLVLLSYIPGIDGLSTALVALLLRFLATFGNGSALEGLVVIGLACGFVGALFDTYAYYYRYLRNG